MYTVYGFISLGFSLRLLKIWYFSFMGLILGRSERLYVVIRGESVGGIKQRTFRSGDNDPEDIVFVYNYC